MTRSIVNERTRSVLSNVLIWGALILFILVTITAGAATYLGVRNFISSGSPWTAFNPSIVDNGDQTPIPDGTPKATPTVPGPVGPEARPWDGASRVTVLVMGLDYRDWASGEGPPRTDSMILLTIDPLTKTAGILNIPRDLWVSIPAYGNYKINMAYYFGEGDQLPGGGPGLAIKTVEQFLGVPINFYAQIDFYAFEKFIDEIGGVEVDVPEKIKIDPIGQGNTVILQPGVHLLNGPQTLAYARARYTEGGDFDRADRQQKVILAVFDKIMGLDMLPTLVAKAPTLYQELASGVHTNMSLDQAISLAWLVQQSLRNKEDIRRGVIGPPEQVILAKTPDGSQDILIPIPSKIRLLRDEIFASGSIGPLSGDTELVELMKAENARLSLLNGSGTIGLAGKTSDYLTSLGADVVNTGDADGQYAETSVIDYTGNPYTLKYLVELMKIQPNRIRFEYNPSSQFDVAINLGSDWAFNNPMP